MEPFAHRAIFLFNIIGMIGNIVADKTLDCLLIINDRAGRAARVIISIQTMVDIHFHRLGCCFVLRPDPVFAV